MTGGGTNATVLPPAPGTTPTPAPATTPDAGDDPEETLHTNIIFTSDSLPAPTGNIPHLLHAYPIDLQRQQSIKLIDFLIGEDPDLLKLNEDPTPRTILISLPRSSKVKLVYCGGVGSSAIGTTSDIDGKFLFLTGDAGNDLGNPLPIVIPPTGHVQEGIMCMTHTQFSSNITSKGENYNYPLVARTNVTNTENIMQLAPIPAFLIYDGFHRNLDASDVYERVLTLDNTNKIPCFTHLKKFLLSCMNSHNLGDNKPWISQDHLMQPVSAPARRWAKKKFETIFPTLVPRVAATPNGLSPEVAALLAQALANRPQAVVPQRAIQEEKKTEDNIGMSDHELEELLLMCGKSSDADPEDLPNWIQECSKKGSESYKLTVIMKHVMNNPFFDDAEVPITRPLLKMILKRQWTGKDGNITRPAMSNSSEGLSPFAVLDIDEDEVARINDADEAFTRASLMTFQDLKKLKNATKPKIPETSDEFMLTLKRFANLLFSIFSDDCPLFQCLHQIINALKKFSRSARIAMTTTTKASILWIVLLQSRQFSIGNMEILAEFQSMHTNLTAKQGTIIHAEVPSELLDDSQNTRHSDDNKENDPSKFRKNEQNRNGFGSGQGRHFGGNYNYDRNFEGKRYGQGNDRDFGKYQKPNGKNFNCWNSKLKDKLQGPLDRAKKGHAKYPGYQRILEYCDADLGAVFGKGNNLCSPNLFFGRCLNGSDCTRIHRLAMDKEVTEILKVVDKFIKDPEGIHRG